MKHSLGLLAALSLCVNAQTIEVQPIDIIYGNQVIRTQHQIVVSSRDEVSIISAEKTIETLGPNMVVSGDGEGVSYLEENAIAEREQEIYDEVNRRTKDAPFTVLFTGNIPDDIQEKRLRMMPEIGVFGDQMRASEASDANAAPDEGAFSPIGKNVSPGGVSGAKSAPVSAEEKLNKLIGG